MKYKVFNKLMAAMLACSMTAAMLVGCGSTDASNQASSSTEKSSEVEAEKTSESSAEAEAFDPRTITEGVKLTIATKENSRIVDWNNMDQTLAIEEALGVDLEFVSYPSADYASKLNVMIMSGEELPDILFSPGSSNVPGWIEEGALIPLNEYYANPDYAKNINDASERTETDIAQYLTMSDGNIYAIPYWNHDPGAEVSQKLWVYQPWLDQLGVKMPETTEEFYELCQKVAATDLNGNGKNDEVCLTASGIGNWFDFLMTPYVYAHDNYFRVVEDGKVSFAYTTEEWKEGLKYIRKFFEEGLIPLETLTQNSDQYKAIAFAETPTLFSFSGWCYEGTDIYRRSEYNYIVALEGPTGRKVSHYQPSLPSVGAVITSDCENPDAAFLVLDYLCSEEMGLTSRYGKQGENWEYWENVQLDNKEDFGPTFEGYDISILAEYTTTGFWYDTKPQTASYLQIGPFIRDKYSNIARVVNRNPSTEEEKIKLYNEDLTSQSIMAAENYRPEEVFDYGPLSVEETKATADIAATLKNYINESTSAFLSGDKDIDKEWDTYLAELEKIGYKTMLEVYQTAYDRVH